jgi:hypothetical protein
MSVSTGVVRLLFVAAIHAPAGVPAEFFGSAINDTSDDLGLMGRKFF